MELIVAVYDDWGNRPGRDAARRPVSRPEILPDNHPWGNGDRGQTHHRGFPGKTAPSGAGQCGAEQKRDGTSRLYRLRQRRKGGGTFRTAERCFVIGGGSVYRQMLPFCDTAYVTKVHVTPESDTFFPNLDEDKDWYLAETLQSGEENGIAYEMCLYRRK